jgi:hypothetical protein
MTKPQTVRFASGTPEAPFSGVWRMVVNKHDVYIGASKAAMSVFKISLHKSGVWILAATQQSGATFDGGNRRAKRWNRPLEHVRGVTRGPSILVPHTSLGSRPLSPNEVNQEVVWYESPATRETVEFSMYLVKPGAPTKWNASETVLAECPLADDGFVVLLASRRQSPDDFNATVEKILRENVFRMSDPSGFTGGSLLWITESRDALRIPMIIDLPVPIGPQSAEAR